MTEDRTPITDAEAIESDEHMRDDEPTSGTKFSLPLLLGLVFTLCIAAVSVLWFVMTEPGTPIASRQGASETGTIGLRGDSRSASQIIRAARRAQEPSTTETPEQ
jgi:hypothetical protein